MNGVNKLDYRMGRVEGCGVVFTEKMIVYLILERNTGQA